MQRVTRSSAVAAMPAPPASPGAPGWFTQGDPGGGIPATVPGYEWFNGVQEELVALVLRGGLALDAADQAQIRKSLDRLFGGGLRGTAASITLTPDDAGLLLVDASGGARTITLPAAAAANGRPILFRLARTDSSANAVTIQRAGADTIEGGASVTLTGQWASVTIVSDGVSRWVLFGRPVQVAAATIAVAGISRLATAAEADAGTLADVAVTPAALGISQRSFAANGWQRLPGGLILQWGTVTLVGATPVTVTFPIAFPTAFRSAAASYENFTGASPVGITSKTATSMVLQQGAIGGTPTSTISVPWFAIGH